MIGVGCGDCAMLRPSWHQCCCCCIVTSQWRHSASPSKPLTLLLLRRDVTAFDASINYRQRAKRSAYGFRRRSRTDHIRARQDINRPTVNQLTYASWQQHNNMSFSIEALLAPQPPVTSATENDATSTTTYQDSEVESSPTAPAAAISPRSYGGSTTPRSSMAATESSLSRTGNSMSTTGSSMAEAGADERPGSVMSENAATAAGRGDDDDDDDDDDARSRCSAELNISSPRRKLISSTTAAVPPAAALIGRHLPGRFLKIYLVLIVI